MPSTQTSMIDGLSTSVAVKAPCVDVETSNITLSGLHGYTEGDRVLLVGQTDATENGIYVASSGSWTRALDADGNRDLVKGTRVLVESSGDGLGYELVSNNPIVIGTTELTFEQREIDSGLRDDLLLATTAADGASQIGFSRTETGAAARTVSAKLMERVTPADFGADTTGASDSSGAWAKAIATGKRIYGGGPQCIYRMDSEVALTGEVDIDLEGATIKPTGNTLAFRRDAVTATASTTVSSGASMGSRSVVIASATGVAIGQWFRISANDSPTHDASSYPSCWGKIVNVAGTTITLDRVLPVTYSGTISFAAYTTAQILGRFHLRNGVLDGSASTYNATSGQAVRVGTYEDVRIENMRLKDWDNAGTLTSALQIYTGISARIHNCEATGTVSGFAPWDIQDCRSAHITNNNVEGSSFGGNITRSEFAVVAFNSYTGYRKRESNEAVSPVRSVRAVKVYGCYEARVIGNHCSDYESGIKVEACFRYTVALNTVKNCGLEASYTGSVALNIASIINGTNMQDGIVTDNTIENCGGIGLGVASDTTGKVIIKGNIVKSVQGVGIYANVNNVQLIGNRIEDWGLRNSSDVGMHYSQGATVIGNRFSNSVYTTLACLRSFFQATYKYDFRDNVCETANAMGVTFEAVGAAQINSGTTATSPSISHTLSRTPDAGEISITPTNNPTTDPGNIWVSNIGSTTFDVNCRTNPGASNATFRWKAAITMPFTA